MSSKQPLRFAIIGAAGYVAPRHLQAVAALGHELVAAYDPHDSVGVLDQFAPKAAFFTEFERFDRHLTRRGDLDYLIVCSPNYLHDAHCRFGLRLGVDVIVEKPVTLNVHNLESLLASEQQSGKHVWCVLQARLHPAVQELRQYLKLSKETQHHVDINYITPRGNWYDYSWKGELSKSGGVETNIGIHLFDILCLCFGAPVQTTVTDFGARFMEGTLEFADCTTRFRVSINRQELPPGQSVALRKFSVDGQSFDFSQGFESLHIDSYSEILAGRGFTLHDARPAVAVAEALREVRYA